jgi:hypothetical protein
MFPRQSRFRVVLRVAGLTLLLAAVEGRDAEAKEHVVSAESEVPARRRLVEVVVTYKGGQLAIKAQNAPLITVLQAVCDRIGAVMDFPADAADRVTADLGPGPQRTVLASLLGNTRFDFATSGRLDDPASIARIELVVKSGYAVPPAQTVAVQAAAVPGKAQAGASARGSGVDKSTLGALRDLLAAESGSSAEPGGNAGNVEAGAANATVAAVEDVLKKAEDLLNSPAAKANGVQADAPAPAAPEAAPPGRHRHRR